MRVLVVSQDPSEMLRATSALTIVGTEIVEATSAADAHREMHTGDFNALVIDGDLRPEGGFSLLFEIRAGEELRGSPTTPALVLIDRAQDRYLAGWAQADDVIVKPSDPFDIAARVERLVAESQPGAPAV